MNPSPWKCEILPYWPSFVILAIGLALTLVLAGFQARDSRAYDAQQFEQQAQQVINSVESRIEYSVQALGALRDRIAAHPSFDEGSWGVCVDTMKPWVNYEGLFEIGFAECIILKTERPFSSYEEKVELLREERSKVIEEKRRFFGDRFTTNTSLCVSPELYVPVRFHSYPEPPEKRTRTYRDFGWDLAGDVDLFGVVLGLKQNRERAGRRRAFYQDGTNSPIVGFIVVLPVYDPLVKVSLDELGAYRQNPELNDPRLDDIYSEACRGLVFGAFDLNKVVPTALGNLKPQIEFLILDRNNFQSSNVLYGSFEKYTSARRNKPYLNASHELRNYGQRLYFHFQSTPTFERQSHRYRAWLAAGLGAVVTTCFSGVTFVQIRARRKAQLISRELRTSRDQLRLASLEREHLSRDLHDGTIQSIYAVGLGLQHCRKVLVTDPARAPDLLANSVDELNGIIRELREFILTLEPELLRGQTISTVLSSFVSRISKTTEARIHLEVDPAAAQLDSRRSVEILNLVREAVCNSLKHGRPSRIDIDLKKDGDHLRLMIRDNGIGFAVCDPERCGYGLSNMRSRAEHLGGHLDLQSTLGAGTQISVIFPSDGLNSSGT